MRLHWQLIFMHDHDVKDQKIMLESPANSLRRIHNLFYYPKQNCKYLIQSFFKLMRIPDGIVALRSLIQRHRIQETSVSLLWRVLEGTSTTRLSYKFNSPHRDDWIFFRNDKEDRRIIQQYLAWCIQHTRLVQVLFKCANHSRNIQNLQEKFRTKIDS